MPRDASGNYTLPAGNPVLPGTLIEAAWANSTLGDVRAALTDSLSRTGQGGMLSPFFNADGIIAAPGISWVNEPTSGWYRQAFNTFRYSVSGSDVLEVNAAGFNVTGTLRVNGVAVLDQTSNDARYILASAKGAASGVAPLDSASKVPVANLPVNVANGVAPLDGSSLVPSVNLQTMGSRVRGAMGDVISALQFRLRCIEVQLINSSLLNGSINIWAPNAITNNLATAGPVANGRDQAAAFAANALVNVYYIWGAVPGLATLSSLAGPLSGTPIAPPTLPSGYTHWAFFGTVRLNAGATGFFAQEIRGAWTLYDFPQEVVTIGTASSYTSVDVSSFVPLHALEFIAGGYAQMTADAGTGVFNATTYLGPASGNTGNEWIKLQGRGIAAASTWTLSGADRRIAAVSPGNAATLGYQMSVTTGAVGGVWINIRGFKVMNGGE